MSLRECPVPGHNRNLIPPGEDLCVACQRDQEEQEPAEDPGPCQHRSIVYTCRDCGEVVPLEGRFYPVITDQHGRILDGKHRRAADPRWFELRLEVPDDVTALAIARATNLRRPLPDDVAATIDELIKRAIQREPVTS